MTFRPVNAVATRDQPTWQRRKLCPRCRTRFTCGHGEPGCWCESIVLRRETLAQIRALDQVAELALVQSDREPIAQPRHAEIAQPGADAQPVDLLRRFHAA